ncbi:MAG: glycosyltransferase family 2 protein [Rikenellaceae bacterium]
MRVNPLVTVIVPNYNHARYLPSRLDSILEQTYENFELIILDDKSTDNSLEVINKYREEPRLREVIVNKVNSGSPFIQWERGIKLAKGKYIWIAESDDYADPQFLEKCVVAMEQHPQSVICMSGSHFADESGNILHNKLERWSKPSDDIIVDSGIDFIPRMFHQNLVYNASMVLFRREGALSETDMQFTKMRYCGDWLFWMEQMSKGDVLTIRQKLNYFRQHSENTTKKGAINNSSENEITYIRIKLYDKLSSFNIKGLSRRDLALFKGNTYRAIKHMNVSKEEKRALFKDLQKRFKITIWDYYKSRYIKIVHRKAIKQAAQEAETAAKYD